MNKSQVMNSINEAIKILKNVDLYLSYNKSREFTLDSSKFSDEFYSVSQKKDYMGIHKIAMKNCDYDILLKDHSFLQFSMSNSDSNKDDFVLRYAYYPNSSKIKTYEEFLEELEFDYDEFGDSLLYEYEQSITEAEFNSGICPIRYDYDFRLYDRKYNGLKHSISHIHVGHNNETRISTSKVLLPEKFILFIIRNVYVKKWEYIVENNELRDKYLGIKQKCGNIDSKYFSTYERNLFYLD